MLAENGGNTKLIRLYSNEGSADVALIAYILAEQEFTSTLFHINFALITNDNEVISVAQKYGIECIKDIP